MTTELIHKTEAFLKSTFASSRYLSAHRDELAYRLEHSYRVANIGRHIAKAEGFDEEAMVIACLLHDISYCEEMHSREQRLAHGRRSAEITAPFLEELKLPQEQINDILYGIAIHVDDVAGFQWRRTAFAESIGDADNIDRFDAYRIYEGLEYSGFGKMSLEEKLDHTERILKRLEQLRNMKVATASAKAMWQERIDFNIKFYDRLHQQLRSSSEII